MSHLFLSYSRSQLALAESLALTLVERGVPVWFDLWALTPGRDWHADIDAAIDAAQAFALVVSAESMDSLTVAEEVERAVDRGKPLWLLAADAAVPRLRHRAELHLLERAQVTLDVRGEFAPAAEALVSAWMRGPSATRASMTLASPAGSRWPRTVRDTALVAALLTLPILGTTVPMWRPFAEFSRLDGLVLLTLASGVVMAVGSAVLLLRRRVNATRLITATFAAVVSTWSGVVLTHRSMPWAWSALIVVSSAALFARLAMAVVTSEDLARWLPATDRFNLNMARARLADRVVRVVEQRWQQAPTAFDPRPYKYRLTSEESDRPIATLLAHALDSSAWVSPLAVGHDRGDAPVLDVLLLTSRSSEARVRRFLETSDGYRVVVLGSPTILPADVEAALARSQWLEFRELLPYQVQGFVGSLRGYTPSRALYGMNVRPFQLSAPVGPNGLGVAVTALQSLASVGLVAGGLAVLDRDAVVVVAAVGVSSWLLALAHAVHGRLLSGQILALHVAASLAIAELFGLSSRVAHVAASSPLLLYAPTWVTYASLATTMASMVWGLWLARRWFPEGPRPADALGGPSPWCMLRSSAGYIIGALLTVLFLALD